VAAALAEVLAADVTTLLADLVVVIDHRFDHE
jgi:hypothetical protein